MTAPAPLHSGNERWQVHCPDPHPDPGCWCYPQYQRLRLELTRLLDGWSDPFPNHAMADKLLTAPTLRIELR